METFTAKVDYFGDVSWRGHLNLQGEKVRGNYPSIYTPVGGDAEREVEVHQVHAQRTQDGPYVVCGWDVVVGGAFVEHFPTKFEAQRYVEHHLIANAYNFIANA